MKALVLVDVQNDFMPDGTLAVPKGDEIVPVINSIQSKFDLIVATQDWHPENHISFANNHLGKEEFDTIQVEGITQVLWPAHCVQDSKGADFHKDLNTAKIEAIFRKGTNPRIDSYSGFYDNAHLKSTGLSGYLKEKGITEAYFCGLATDICVYYTLKDGITEGFSSYLIEDASKPLDKEEYEKIKKVILELGGEIIQSSNL